MKPGSATPWLTGLAATVYVAMWIGWASGWGWLDTVDGAALDAAHRVGVEHPGWVTSWDVFCTVFSPVSFRLLTLGLIVYEWTRRRRRVALFLFVTVELSAVLTEVAKRLAERPRPETAMVDALASSFPSGHALGLMVTALALGIVLLPRIRRSRRPWWIAASVLIVVGVGIGRVALNVHHPSDVVAGWALGYLYFLACVPLLRRRVTVDETPVAPGTAR